jgi:PST family polysaccharide transporter
VTSRRLRDLIRHPITLNVIGLYVLQVGQFVVPLITLPYVARVLSPSEFGLVLFSQGFAFVLIIFVDWGFSYVGVREVAEKRGDFDELSRVVQRIRGAQLLLAAGSVPIALVALLTVPKFSTHPLFLILAWVAAVATGLTPGWFFLGMERVRLSAFISLAFRVVGAALTFAFVKHADDGWIVMAVFAGSSVAGLIVLDLRMYRLVRRLRPRLHDSWLVVRGSTMLFVATIAATLYTSFNVVLVGLFEPAAAVAHYGAAERVLRVSLLVLGPVGISVYPRLVALQRARRHARARQLLGLATLTLGVIGLLLALVLALFAPLLIHVLFGRQFGSSSVSILRVLVAIIPIAIIGGTAGTWLVTLHMDRSIVLIVVCGGLLNVALVCVLTPLFGPIGTAWSVVCAEAAVAVGTWTAVLKPRHGPAVSLLARPAPRP